MADDSSVRFILDAIAWGGELRMDFKPVATNAGISIAGNASRKFQEQLKKFGYKYDKDQNGFIKVDEATATPAKKTVTKKGATNGQKTGGNKGTAQKRKLEGSEHENGSSNEENKTKNEDEA